MVVRLAALVVVAALSGVAVRANVVVPAEFREITSEASLIVRGRVTDVRGVVVEHGIDSIVTVSVEAVLKGSAGAFVSVRVPGGDVGRTRFLMVGAPRFTVGDQAFLFLRQDAGVWRPVGLSQGVYRIGREPASGRVVVESPVIAGVTAPVGRVTRGDARRRGVPVTTFESMIRLVLAGQAATGTAIRR